MHPFTLHLTRYRMAARWALLMLILWVFYTPLKGQMCGTTKRHEHLLLTNPQYRENYQKQNEYLQKIAQSKILGHTDNEIYTIPVVVHVIHLGESINNGSNISDTKIKGAIDGLNDRFRNYIGDGVDVGIQFCLALRDPNGNATTGIVRKNGSHITGYKNYGVEGGGETSCSNCATHEDIINLSNWPQEQYFNIYVISRFSDRTKGLANFPVDEPYAAMIASEYMNYDDYTLTHEMGHALYLFHTFEGGNASSCAKNDNCKEDGDKVCDTPPHQKICLWGLGVCGENWLNTTIQNNYMNYCNPSKNKGHFTEGQKQRMREEALHLSSLKILLNSQACNPPLPDLTVSNASVSPVTVDPGQNVTLSFRINNIGSGTALPHYTSFHFSSNVDVKPGNGATYLDEFYISQTLSSNSATTTITKSVKIPTNIGGGTYYLFFSADGADNVQESNETNNQVYVAITVRGSTPTCSPNTPSGLASHTISQTTATLSWSSVSGALRYNVRYRRSGNSSWSTINTNAGHSFISLTGLSCGSSYEWQVRTECSGGSTGNYSSTRTFSTTSCGSSGNCPPENDHCSNATTIISNGDYLQGSVRCANGSYGANSCSGCYCQSPDDKDVYYKFVAQATSHTVTVSHYASNFDAVIELRTACASGSGNYLWCHDPTGVPSSTSETWTGLNIGQTYFIRVYEYNYSGTPPSSDNFRIQVTHTPQPVACTVINLFDEVSLYNASGGNNYDNSLVIHTAQGVCNYTVTKGSGCGFVTINNPTGTTIDFPNRFGQAEIFYSVSRNESYNTRTCILNVNGRTHTIRQNGCDPYFYPYAKSMQTSGGSYTLEVDAESFCSWNFSQNNCSWVSFNQTSGSGRRNITVTVSPNNTTSARTCRITLNNGETHTINQQGIVCTAPSGVSITSSSANNTLCEDGTVRLTAYDPNCSNCTYTWNNGTVSPSINVSVAGKYSVTASNPCGSRSAEITISQVSNPVITVNNAEICRGDLATLTASGADTYYWIDHYVFGETMQVSPEETSMYIVQGTKNGCMGTAMATVTVKNEGSTATITASGPTTFCPNNSVVLTANEGNSYLWSTGATTRSITVSQAGSFYVSVSQQNCTLSSDTLTVTVSSDTSVTEVSATLCPGQSYTLPDGTQVSAAGTYPVVLPSSEGCVSVVVTTLSLLPPIETTVNAESCNPADVGTTVQNLTSVDGCDSVITTITTLVASYNITVNLESCNPADAGTVVQNLTSANGCDSIITTITTLSADCDARPFITVWNLSHSGSGATQIQFNATIAAGGAAYEWETIPAGTSGSGTLAAGTSLRTIPSIPAGATIRLRIAPDNLQRFFISFGTDRFRLTDIEQWGTAAWTSMFDAFQGCGHLGYSATDVPNLAGVTSMTQMFMGCAAFNGAIGNWNTSSVTEMTSVFTWAASFNQPLNGWDVSNVTNMLQLFSSATSFNQPLDSWNTSSLKSMHSMFRNASSFNQPLNNWNTSNVTDMPSMFDGATAFNQPLNSWNTSGVTWMHSMFRGATAFNQPLDNWNTSNVTDMPSMFDGATAFNQNLSSWTLHPSVDMVNMLNNSGLDCNNYSATLTGWAANNPAVTNRILGATGLKYGSHAVAAHNVLVQDRGWTISGDQFDSQCTECEPFSNTFNLTTCNPAEAGTVVQNLTSVNGCDSIITMVTTLLPSYNITVYAESCHPADTGRVVENLTKINGCDSIITTITTLVSSYNITVNAESCNPADAGIVVQNLTSVDGCDSIVTTITALVSSYDITVNLESCNPNDAGTVVQNLTSVDGCDSIVTTITTLVSSYNITINLESCNPNDAGTVVQNLISVDGCDSIVTTITMLLPSYNITVNVESCNPNDAGTVVQNLTSIDGCDSIVTTITTLVSSYNITLNLESCNPADVGTTVQNLTSTNGCDSIVTTITTLVASYNITVNLESCNPNDAGTVVQNLTSVDGCDSVITTITTLLPSYTFTVNETTCQAANIGTVINTYTAANGCDSIVTINTTLSNFTHVSINKIICRGAQYMGYSETGIYVDTLTASADCDSIITLNLLVTDEIVSIIHETICGNGSVGGYNQTGVYIDTLPSTHGCDSVRILNLSVAPAHENVTLNERICTGESLMGYTQSGIYVDTFKNVQGCDSVIQTLFLTVSDYQTRQESKTICQGESYYGHSTSGTFIDLLSGNGSCDTLLILTLQVIDTLNAFAIEQAGNLLSVDSSLTQIQWYRNDTLLVGETTNQIAVFENGTYTVRAVQAGGCPVSSMPLTVLSLSVGEFEQGVNFLLYPNPFSNSFILQGDNLPGADIFIYNNLGQQMGSYQSVQNSNLQITADNWSEGLYIIQIFKNGKGYHFKLIKK